MYKNIVFDIGGVVVNYKPRDYLVDRFFHERTEKKLYDAVFGSEEWVLLDRGELSWKQASEIFMQRGEEKNVAFEMRTLLEEWTEMMTIRGATVALLRILKKKGFALYYLTNVSREVLGLWRQYDFWGLFDGGVASCETGLLKPDLKIYQQLLEKYQLKPQETIFTDDHKDNTAAAYACDITGIPFKNVKNFCKMLVTYGIEI